MLKKVWNSCNFAAVFLFLLAATLPAQTKTSDGTVSSSISMPEMPSVSMPSVGSGFYTPGRSDFYNPNLTRNQNVSSNNAKPQAASTQTQATSSTADSASKQNSALANAQTLSTIAKKSSSALNQLTADDISSMSNLGIFSQLSGLLGRGKANLESELLEAQNTVTAQTGDSETLKQILSELNELKSQFSNGTTASEKSAGENAFSNIVKKEPKILRFIVNGYDILATCKKIYFSELETDGTFLLTGDRKYMSEGKARSETFYFYFHAQGTENGITKYAVTPAVSQDYENQYSYLYQLTQKNTLTADRTGNLVTLRVSDGEWNMDVLLSLDK